MSTPLEDFFAQFANLGFEYRGGTTALDNLERLQEASNWDEDSDEWRETLYDFNNALTRQFNVSIGKRTDLPSWQSLCRLIDITPLPETIHECQTRVRDSHVNIVDLLENARIGKPVRKFRTVEELSAYTLSTGRIFPKGSAYAGGLLRQLLREIFKYASPEVLASRARAPPTTTSRSLPACGPEKGGAKRKRRRRRRRAPATAAAQTSDS